MQFLKNKKLLLIPVIVFTVIFIFSLTLIPSVNPSPKNLPIAIVNEDEGVKLPNGSRLNFGEEMLGKINAITAQAGGKVAPVKWIEVSNSEKLKAEFAEQKYYAALVIPKGFSMKQASLQTPNPISPELEVIINEGKNKMAATIASSAIDGVITNINNSIRTQLLEKVDTLTSEQVATIVTPITKKVTTINPVGPNTANGNAPLSMFQPLWIASMAGAALTFVFMNKMTFTSRKEKFIAKGFQILFGASLAILTGWTLTTFASSLVGFDIPKFADTAWFLTITYFSFFLMISAVISWLSIRGLGVFGLLLFFGIPLLAMPEEFLSPFYRDYVHSWLPMRFLIDGLRELFFFGESFSWDGPTGVLVGISIVSIVVLLASAMKSNAKEEKTSPKKVKTEPVAE
jgi:YhgE/Pip-like protein